LLLSLKRDGYCNLAGKGDRFLLVWYLTVATWCVIKGIPNVSKVECSIFQ